MTVPLHRLGPDPSSSDHPVAADREARLSSFCGDFRQSGNRLRRHVVRHPSATVQAVLDLMALPLLAAELSDTRDGRVLHAFLTRRTWGIARRAGVGVGVVVLPIPAEASDYRLGASRQTLRRKVRAAQKAGVTCRRIDNPAEQYGMLRRLDEVLPQRADPRFRLFDTDSTHLLGAGLFCAASDAAGEPLVLAVAAHDGKWALQQRFVSLGDSPVHSDARYLLAQTLVEELSRLGVRHLAEDSGALEVTTGLRHFQRMLGFRIARVRVLPMLRQCAVQEKFQGSSQSKV